jgi:hypothetical protein
VKGCEGGGRLVGRVIRIRVGSPGYIKVLHLKSNFKSNNVLLKLLLVNLRNSNRCYTIQCSICATCTRIYYLIKQLPWKGKVRFGKNSKYKNVFNIWTSFFFSLFVVLGINAFCESASVMQVQYCTVQYTIALCIR